MDSNVTHPSCQLNWKLETGFFSSSLEHYIFMQSFLKYLLLGEALSESSTGAGGAVLGSERQQKEQSPSVFTLPHQWHNAHFFEDMVR